MTISTTASRQDYTGDGCTKAFAYTFKILATTNLDVFVGGTQKTLTTDYTVSGAGSETGGTVSFGSAPSCNLAVAIVRNVPYTQATDYPENDPFPAATHEDALDKLTMLVQQVKEFATRSWRFAAGSVRAAAGYTVDEPKALTYPRVKSDCTGIEFVTLTACGTYADPVTTQGDLIQGSGTGSQERLGIGSCSAILYAACTGKVAWTPAGTCGQYVVFLGASNRPGYQTPYPFFNYTFNNGPGIWGAGASAAPTGWTSAGAGVAIARTTTGVKFGTYGIQITPGAGAAGQLYQDVDLIADFGPIGWWASKTVTLGAWVRATAASQTRLVLDDGITTKNGEFHSGNSTAQFLKVRLDINAAATRLRVMAEVAAAGSAAQFNGFTLVVGEDLADTLPSGWRGRKAMLLAASNLCTGVNAGATVYLFPSGEGTDETYAPQVPFKGVARNLTATCSPPGSGKTTTYTVRKNFAATSLTTTIAGTTQRIASDVTNEVSFAKLDCLAFQVSTQTGSSASAQIIACEYEEIP